MAISYDVFAKGFLSKVTDYDLANLAQDVRTETVDGYMKMACSRFNKICKYSLINGDDEKRELPGDIPAEEYDTIVDIVSEGMVVMWLKPYTYRAENLENILNTRDIFAYSPAELLRQVSGVYDKARKEFVAMMRQYSYDYGDLTNLSL